MWLLLVSCLHRAPAEDPPTPDVRWSPDGRVLVDHDELYSPSGKHRAWIDPGQLNWGESDGPSHLVEVTRWLAGDPAEDPVTLMAWIDEDRLYLHQIDVYVADGPASACKIYDTRTAAWSEPAACLEGSFYQLYGIELRDGVAIVESAGEGHPALDVFRWTPESGAGERVAPEVDLYPFGPVWPLFRADGVALITPCHLGERDRPCQRAGDGLEEDGPWRHYAVKDGQFVLVRDNLPPVALPHPTEPDRYAWSSPGRVCTGDPAGKHACEAP